MSNIVSVWANKIAFDIFVFTFTYTICIYNVIFEWDETKRLWTIAERSLDFVDAVAAFDGRPALHVPAIYEGEERFLTVFLMQEKLYTVMWTWRQGNRRIISFRRSRDGEEKQYDAIYG